MRVSVPGRLVARVLVWLSPTAAVCANVVACSTKEPGKPHGWEAAVRVGPSEVSTTSPGRTLGGVGVDAQGNAVVTYRRIDGAGANVMVSRLAAASSSPWSSPDRIDGAGESVPLTTVSGVKRPHLAMAPGGAAVVAWPALAAGKFSLRAARLDPAGGWATTDSVATDLSAPEIDALVPAPDGSVLAAWHDRDNDSVARPRVSRSSTSTGWSAADVLAPSSAVTQTLAMNRAGNGVALWLDRLPGKPQQRVSAKSYRVGTGWDADATVVSEISATGAPLASPTVAVDAAGNATAVWLLGGTVWTARMRAGSSWDAPFALDNSGGVVDRAALCIAEGGVGYAVWATGRDLRMRAFDPTSGWSQIEPAPRPASTTYADAEVESVAHPRCVLDQEGQLLIAVASLVRSSVDGGAPEASAPPVTSTLDAGIWIHSYAAGTWKDPLRITVPDGAGNENPEIALNAAGIAVVAWEHFADDGVSIWAARRNP